MAAPRSETYTAVSGTTVRAGRIATIPAYILGQPLNQWFNAPNSAVTSVASDKLMNAYSGTVLVGNKLYSFGGGHGASVDNTVAVYDFDVGTGWAVASAITPMADMVYADNQNFGENTSWWGTPPNRKPNPPHTYSSGFYSPEKNRIIWVGQRGVYNRGGEPEPRFWLQFTIPGHQWIQPESSETIKDQMMGRAVVRLPNGKAYGSFSQTRIYEYDPAKAAGSEVTEWLNNSALDWGGYGQYMHDAVGNRILRVGSVFNPGGTNNMMAIDLTTKAVTNLRLLMTGASGDLSALDALNIQDSPGACVDPINNRIVYPTGIAGGSFYAIDLATMAVTLVSPATASGHTVSAKPDANAGIYGRIHYHAPWKVLIYNPAGAAQTCLMRLA